MSIDVFREHVVKLTDAAKRLPRIRRGKKIRIAAIQRWAFKGIKGRAGEIVRLETIRLGRTNWTSLEALQRYFYLLSGIQPRNQLVEQFGARSQFTF